MRLNEPSFLTKWKQISNFFSHYHEVRYIHVCVYTDMELRMMNADERRLKIGYNKNHQMFSHTEAEIGRMQFCKQFQIHIFINENVCILIQISLKVFTKVSTDNRSALVQVIGLAARRCQPITWNLNIDQHQCHHMASHYLKQWWPHTTRCNIVSLGINELTHLPLVPHICVRDSGEHWFR